MNDYFHKEKEFSFRPHLVGYEITYDCNHKCGYCFNCNRKNDEPTGHVPIERVFPRVMEWIVNEKFYEVNFSGGEPLLPKIKPFLFEGLEICKENSIAASINTNLVFFSKEDAGRLKEGEVNDILVSFPHYEEEEYNRITQSNDYKKVLANFELALQFELPVEANMVVLPDTVDDVLKTGIFLKEKLGIDHFGVSPVQITDSYLNRYLLTKEQLNHILDQLIELNRAENIETAVVRPIEPCAIENKDILDKYPEFVKSCPAGIQELTITSWGEIKACKSYSRSYGTVFSTNVNNAMVKMNEWRSFSSGKSIIPEECFNCTLFTFCRGGCRAEALNLKNHLKATSINYTGPITGRVPTWFTDPFYQIENININPDIKVLNREDGGLDIISKHGLINLNSQEKHLFKCLTKYILENEFNLDKFISEYELRYDFVFYFIDYLLSREVFLPD